MKIFGAIIRTLLGIVFVAFCAVVLTFFLTVFIPNNVLNAVEIFRKLLQ